MRDFVACAGRLTVSGAEKVGADVTCVPLSATQQRVQQGEAHPPTHDGHIITKDLSRSVEVGILDLLL